MMDADLTPGANLSGAYLDGAMLAYSNLSRATLTVANLPEADLSCVIGPNLSGALDVPQEYR